MRKCRTTLSRQHLPFVMHEAVARLSVCSFLDSMKKEHLFDINTTTPLEEPSWERGSVKFNDVGSPSPPWPPAASPCAYTGASPSRPFLRCECLHLCHTRSQWGRRAWASCHSGVPCSCSPDRLSPAFPLPWHQRPLLLPPPSPRYLKVSLVPVPLTRLLLTTNKSKQDHIPPPPQPPSGLAFLPASPPPAGGCSSLSPPSASPQFLCYLLIFCTVLRRLLTHLA